MGVSFEGLVDQKNRQLDLFDQPTDAFLEKKDGLMNILDSINQKYGRHTIKLAAEGVSMPWAMRANMHSPHYTTRWSDLPVIKNRT